MARSKTRAYNLPSDRIKATVDALLQDEPLFAAAFKGEPVSRIRCWISRRGRRVSYQVKWQRADGARMSFFLSSIRPLDPVTRAS